MSEKDREMRDRGEPQQRDSFEAGSAGVARAPGRSGTTQDRDVDQHSEERGRSDVAQQRPGKDAKVLQAAGSGKLFVVERNQRRLIPDPFTFRAMGLDPKRVEVVDDEELD